MRSSPLLLALLLVACGPGLDGPSLKSGPLAVVRGRVDLAALTRTPGTPLQASLVWAGVPYVPSLCARYWESPLVRSACMAHEDLRAQELGGSVTLDDAGDGSFEIPLLRLPGAEVAVGRPGARISYGAVFVSEEVDFFDPEMSPGHWASSGRRLAASFVTQRAAHERIAFREGDFDADSYFLPLTGCVPSPGFSVVRAPAPDAQAPADCEVRPLSAGIEVKPLSELEEERLRCGDMRVWYDAPFEPPEPGAKVECLAGGAVAIGTEGPGGCTRVRVVRLLGCGEMEDDCAHPGWDLRDAPPDWWPSCE